MKEIDTTSFGKISPSLKLLIQGRNIICMYLSGLEFPEQEARDYVDKVDTVVFGAPLVDGTETLLCKR